MNWIISTSGIFDKMILVLFMSVIFIGCLNENYSLVVDNPLEGNIFINDKPLENWLTKEPFILEDKNILYFLNLSHEKYNLKIKLNDGSMLDTFFVVNSGESYFKIDLKTGELLGFEFE